jgi:hypothetical protein
VIDAKDRHFTLLNAKDDAMGGVEQLMEVFLEAVTFGNMWATSGKCFQGKYGLQQTIPPVLRRLMKSM